MLWKIDDGSNLGPYHDPGCSWEDEVEILKEKAEGLKDNLYAIEQHRDELEAETIN